MAESRLSSHRALLDGEIVRFDESGRPSFAALQPRIRLASRCQAPRRAPPVTYVIFDLLWLDGHSLIDRPYAQRRQALGELKLEGDHWRTPPPLEGRGHDVLEASRAAGLEGIVCKRVDGRYRPGQRDGSWLKIKNTARQELVVGGWTPGSGRRAGQIGALLLGTIDDTGLLRYAGQRRQRIHRRRAREADSTPHTADPQGLPARPRPGPNRRAPRRSPNPLVVESSSANRPGPAHCGPPSIKGFARTRPRSHRRRASGPVFQGGRGDGDRKIVVRRPDKLLYPAAGLTSAASSTTTQRSRPSCCRTCATVR